MPWKRWSLGTALVSLLSCALLACASAPSASPGTTPVQEAHVVAPAPTQEAPAVGPASAPTPMPEGVAEERGAPPAAVAAAEPEPEITCEQLVDHMQALGGRMHSTVHGEDGSIISEEDRAMTADELNEWRERRLKRCHESRPVPQEIARCIMKAENQTEFEACVPSAK